MTSTASPARRSHSRILQALASNTQLYVGATSHPKEEALMHALRTLCRGTIIGRASVQDADTHLSQRLRAALALLLEAAHEQLVVLRLLRLLLLAVAPTPRHSSLTPIVARLCTCCVAGTIATVRWTQRTLHEGHF